MKTKSVIFSLLVALLSGCSGDEPVSVNEPPAEITLSRSQQDIVDSEARFAFDFFKQTSAWEGCKENMVISPLSLSIDLAMLANGAGEKTYQEIISALQIPDATVEELNTLHKTLVRNLLGADRKVELSIANAMWNDCSFDIKDSFIKNINDYYNTDIQSLNFSDNAGSKNVINSWASKKTNGRISKLYDDENDLNDVQLVLCNALSFKGEWTSPFDRKKTQQSSFTNIDNSESMVDVMVKTDFDNVYSYASTEIAEIVRLPYGNRTYSMYVILPSVDNNEDSYKTIYERFIENINYNWWIASKERMGNSNLLTVYIPKFKVETKCPLIGITTLHELAGVVYNPDMINMTDSNINFLRLDQRNTIEVSEEGTVAASVSKGDVSYTSPLPIGIKINRPFIFLIEENSTGAILFIGKVTKL